MFCICRYFNSLQSECFSTCFLSDVNMIISAPTGSGKTVLFELCILRLLSKFISAEGRFVHIRGTLKTVYIAPSKALVQEKLRDWSQKLGSLGITCLELTGDNEFEHTRSRHYSNHSRGLYANLFMCILFANEVHLPNDPLGAALEAIVSRLKMVAQNPRMKSSSLAGVRYLAVSATIPNIDDLAEWLMVPIQGIKRFGEEMRPVKLTTKVFGYTPAKNDFLFEKRLQNYISDILMQYSRGKSALVFCSTRKGAQEAAQRLSQIAMTFVGYHNGGLSMKDRSLIEGLFLNVDLQILCTTNNLAHGINLPAHTVVIKSTQYMSGYCVSDSSEYVICSYVPCAVISSLVMQMCGRAGRPPFDDTGMVLIMTRKETVHLYENLLNGCELVESQLLSCVTEHLTAEIVQLTVSDITRAIEWLKCSYLYNPENYAIKKGIPSNRIEKHIQEICVKKVNELSHYQMIWTDEDGFLLRPLEPGRLMMKYYLKFDTMKYILQAPSNCSIEDALHIICRADEIAWIQLRRNEKKLINDINADKDGRLRFHILGDKGKRKKRIQTREEKIFVLANDCLTGDPLAHDLSISQDMTSICSNGNRIAKCMKDYFIHKKNYKGAINSTLLAKSLHQKLWDDSPYLLKQLPGIGMVTAKALHSMGVKSFETLSEADPRKIEIVTGRKYPFGNHIKESLLSLPPKVEMKVEEAECPRQGKSKIVVTLTRLSQQPLISTKRHYADMVVGVEEDNLILSHEKISPYSAKILLSSPQQGKLTVKADLIFEDLIGIDIHQEVTVWEIISNAIHKPGVKQVSSFRPSKDVFLVEDDAYCASQAPTDEPHKLNESPREVDSMPTFKLIDEESEDGKICKTCLYASLDIICLLYSLLLHLTNEGAPATETEDKDCQIISEKTVFNHIREKAKKLPVLATSTHECCPSLETLTLIRKRTRERQLEVDNILEIFEDAEKNEVPLANDAGKLHPEPGSTTSRTLTEETIFEHIRRKAKNFPLLDELKSINTKSSSLRNEPALENRSEFCGSSLDNTFQESHSGVSRSSTDTPGSKLVTRQVQYPERSTEANGKQLCSPVMPKRQCCSVELAGDGTRKVDSFMGFKSVFSFL
ncbi:hypothetical protein RJ639_035682 [Escallonia herrerae]|uniref:DNA 3'-5' helicase n=1 Tax=Escallonia herrerae TaxID=1293975 RepID=A0AA88WS66_9ASTE|nr:hypothetical protein RJ639_035682 [Escallonia herrerae]